MELRLSRKIEPVTRQRKTGNDMNTKKIRSIDVLLTHSILGAKSSDPMVNMASGNAWIASVRRWRRDAAAQAALRP